MPAIVPSYIAKLTCAKQHLVDLQEAVDAYAATHPYAVRKGVEGKKETPVWRLEFTRSPADTDIPILAADAIYNMRSALDHLMNAMVAKNDRGKAMFPVFFEGVWDAIVPGENQQRIKERLRWASDIKTLSPAAAAVLKSLQAPDTDTDDPGRTYYLRLINRLSNRDRHEKLPVVGTGLRDHRVFVTTIEGDTREVPGVEPMRPLQNHAPLGLPEPENVVDVQIQGDPLVAIEGQIKHTYIEIPQRLAEAAAFIEDRVLPHLTPFVRADSA